MCCNQAAAGAIVRRNMAPTPPSTIAGTDGRAVPSGADCSKRCAMFQQTHFIASTRRRPRRIARRPAEKGGGSASYRSLPWRAHDQDPRGLRCARACHRHRGDTGTTRGRTSSRAAYRPVAAEPQVRGRHRLRQQCAPPISARARNAGRHPQQPDTQAFPRLRPQSLHAAKPHRASLLPPQGLAARRNTLRQARPQLSRRSRHRSNHHMVVLIESGA
jgi:hypothetical protein